MYGKKPQGWVKHADFILLDVVCLQIAFVLAYITRHGFLNPYSNDFYVSIAIVYILVDIAVLIINRTLKNVLKRDYLNELLRTIKHVFIVSVFITVYLFSTKESVEYSRTVFYILAVYYAAISYAARLLWKRILLRRMRITRHTAMYFLTTSERAVAELKYFEENNMDRYFVQGICILDEDRIGEIISGVAVSATAETVLDYLCDKWVDEVFVSVPAQYPNIQDLITAISETGIVVHVKMDEVRTEEWQRKAIEKIAGSTVCTLSMTMANSSQLFWKRMLDIVGGLVGCIITGILTLIIGPMIYIKSPGPIFFAQTRVGKNGKKFKMYKFRSMYLDAEERKAELMKENRVKDGMMFKLDFDPRIIGSKKLPDGSIKKGIGNFIRDWSLDEFPQFFNVLKGDISLCGTRPPTVDEWEKYELRHRARLAIKPGITGLWQISGRSNITDFEQVVELDKKYIREWSMALDLKILLRTIKVVLGKDGSM